MKGYSERGRNGPSDLRAAAMAAAIITTVLSGTVRRGLTVARYI